MLKIRDNVDLKELERYGFDDMGVCYKRHENFGVQFFINKGSREIKRLHPFSLREKPTREELLDLDIANLIEKVDDKQ